MNHLDARLGYPHPPIGYALIATAHIPRGSIGYIHNARDAPIPPDDPRLEVP